MIAIIPARGGSKGLPGKNIKMLRGKPLIAYTIEVALKSKYITRVILSTDDEEIAKVGLSYGAEVPFLRPDFLATDTALAIDVYKYMLDRLEKAENLKIEEFIVLQPTSPLREFSDINTAIKLFKEKNADSVISYCEEHHPIRWHKYLTNDNRIVPIFSNEQVQNRQAERPSYYPNGAIYVFKKRIIVEEKTYYTDASYAIIMSRKNSVDIDTLEDFEYAEFLLNK